MNSQFPTGTVTFLFTDIEGSTQLWQKHPDEMKDRMVRHDEILREALESKRSYIFKTVGDGFCAAFSAAGEALRAAVSAQRNLHAEEWGNTPIKVRMGIHTGNAEIQADGDYSGYASLSRVQRLMSAGYGGQTLLSNATLDLVRDELPDGVSLRDLGEHRLKDLIRPEHIHQVDIPNLPTKFPALKTLNMQLNNLPCQLTSFIGREEEMAEINQALESHRLVTLTGSGGTGKTRLSLQVAAELVEQYPDGVWFIELAPLTDPDLIPQAILSVLGTGEQPGKTATQSLSEYVHEKKLLLILDNCEHIIEACARLADILLSNSPGLKILASSREALGVKGEMAWHVPSLSVPDIRLLPSIEQFTQYEAVRLFIERATLAQAHFHVTKENERAIAQICSRLDGIPLALELAAARVKALNVEQIATRLDDRFRLLTGGARTSLPRQQTLRAMIDWSYNLLSENERVLLRRLAVFVGGWTLEAAENVCKDDESDSDVLDLLTRLVDKSLVSMDERRYHMLETTRQYAREKLFKSGEGEALRDRHLDYFLEFAGENDLGVDRPIDQDLAENNMHAEQDNLRTALLWALDSEPLVTIGLAVSLSEFWLWADLWEECIQWLEKSIGATTGHPSAVRVRAMLNLSMCLLQVAKSDQAHEIITAALAEAQNQPDKSLIASALAYHGWIGLETGHADTAQTFFEQALPLARETNNILALGIALVSLGSMAAEDDFTRAEAYFLESLNLKMNVKLQAMHIHALAYWFLSSFVFARGEIQKAREYIESALAVHRHGRSNPTVAAHFIEMLGRIQIAEGNLEPARQSLRESTVYLRDYNSIACLAHGLEAFARLALAEADPSRAAQILGSAEAHLELLNMSMIPAEKVLYNQSVAAVRMALAGDAFASAWNQGRRIKIEEAVERVLKGKKE